MKFLTSALLKGKLGVFLLSILRCIQTAAKFAENPHAASAEVQVH